MAIIPQPAGTTTTNNTKPQFSQDRSTSLTVTFSEESKGWICFKSFIQDNGLSLNNDYYTIKDGGLWKHHHNETRNNFYNIQEQSFVDVLFNEESATVKSFASMKYEGSQAKITENLGSIVNGVFYPDNEYYNNIEKDGWYVEFGITDLQASGEMEFKDKEGKGFSYMKGWPVENKNYLNSEEFSFQGIDELESIDGGIISCYRCNNGTVETSTTNATFVNGSWVCPETWTTSFPYDCGGGGFDCSAQNVSYIAVPDSPTPGSIEVYANSSSDDMPYLFSLVGADGITYSYTSGNNPLSYGGGSTIFGNLPSQQYTVTATSQNGCQVTQSATITAPISGCTDPTALNYDPNATLDDGSCIVCSTININYTITSHPMSNLSNGIRVILHNTGEDLPYTVACLDSQGTTIGDSSGAFGWSSGGTTSQGDIVYFGQGTPLITGTYTIIITTTNGCTSQDTIFIDNVVPLVYGCTDPLALNYYAGANVDDGSCTYTIIGPVGCQTITGAQFEGCDDWNNVMNGVSTSSNYTLSSLTTHWYNILSAQGYQTLANGQPFTFTNLQLLMGGPNGCCGEPATGQQLYGCMDSTAENYSPLANVDDGSCCYQLGCWQ